MLEPFRSYPVTALLVSTLTVVPGAVVISLIRSDSTEGQSSVLVDEPLIQISEELSMLQSFRIESEAKIPPLWIERLGERTAADLWAQHDGQLWWQAWPEEGEPCLILKEDILEASSAGDLDPESLKPSESVRLHRGLILLFADALNRQSFDQRFRPGGVVSPPIEQQCFDQLNITTAVLWKPSAVASMAGALTPLLQSASHGCVAIEFRGRELRWMGVVASRSLREASKRLGHPDPRPFLRGGSSLTAVETSNSDRKNLEDQSPLLRLQSHSTRTLLGALLNTPLIRDGLESNYGLIPNLRNQLLAAPLNLQVLQNQKGPFQAAVQLDLALPSPNPEAISSLKTVSNRLNNRGLTSKQRRLQRSKGENDGEQILWYDNKKNTKRLLGGWSWTNSGSTDLGIMSLQMTLASQPDLNPSPTFLTGAGHLKARVRPSKLQALGLIPKTWPAPVRRAHTLEFSVKPLEGSATSHDEWRLIAGYLELP